jgi:Membrane bound O-acyl transferase family
MKMVSYAVSPSRRRQKFFVTTFLSLRSMDHVRLQKLPSAAVSYFVFGLLLALSIYLIRNFLAPLSYVEIVLISPVIYLLTETMAAFGQIVTAIFGIRSFPMHDQPLISRSLSEFWGRRWNVWVQDWLRDIQGPVRHFGPRHRMVIVFLASGIFHELMINLPYFLVFKVSYFGTMISYFLVQAMALWFQKHYFRLRSKFLQRAYMFMSIMLPSPLFINVPLLRFFGI